jgi:four helix bundle protein
MTNDKINLRRSSMPERSPTDIQKRTFDFAVCIIRLVDKLPRTLATTEIGRQMLRSGTSVGANVQEADAAESRSDFIHKMGIALKEARETRYWLGLVDVTILPDNSEVLALLKESTELTKILFTIIANARKGKK